MDQSFFRQMALNLVAQRKPDASVPDLLAEADTVVAWLSGNQPAERKTEAPNAQQHESAAAVDGQEPKGE